MVKEKCAWCGLPFEAKKGQRYCTAACCTEERQDKEFFQRALKDWRTNFNYYRKMAQRILQGNGNLVESLESNRWDHLVVLHDQMAWTKKRLVMADQVIDHVLSAVSTKPLEEGSSLWEELQVLATYRVASRIWE